MPRPARRWIWPLLAASLIGALFGGWRLARAWRTGANLAEVRRLIQQGRHGLAIRALGPVLDSNPDQDEACYLLGLCEQARGRPDPADRAWARVPAGSPFAPPAIAGRASILIDRGRLLDAETFLDGALGDPRIDGFELRRLLTPLLWQEGRIEEARRLVEANWGSLDRLGRGGSQEGVEMVRLHFAMRVGSASVDAVRSFLDRAERLAPEDPRLRLGRANLAIRQGAFAEAGRSLDECLRAMPDDIPAWRSRLELAVATGNLAEALEAMRRLPASIAGPAKRHRLAAWIAARRSDPAAERVHLEALAELEPGDASLPERLAALAIREGQPARAEALRRRKAEVDKLNEQFREVLLRDQPLRDAPKLADLAERVGEWFEARAFAAIALASEPDRDDMRSLRTRLEARVAVPGTATGTLAEAIGTDLGGGDAAPGPSKVRPSSSPPPSLEARFDDAAAGAGLAHVFRNGETKFHALPEVSCGGVALLDYDGDGWLDVFALQGGAFPPRGSASDGKGTDAREAGDRLFRNRRDGTFEDVTESAGLPGTSRGYGHAVAVGDVDNDGHPDLFLTRWRSYALYRNRGDGTFEDVTGAAGLGGDRDWPTSAAFADLDNDGDLDLYVCHYLRWDPDRPRLCQNEARTAYTSCDPLEFDALPDHLFRNDGGHFTDVTTEAGIVDEGGRGFGVIAVDVDDDNRLDLFVSNDRSANYLFHNRGGLRFEERGLLAGVACNAHGSNQAGMGVAAGDVDGDGKVDLAVTNFHDEATTLFLNLGEGQFVDHTDAVGLTAPSRTRLGFGLALLDANNDGRLDVLSANGHVNDYRPKVPYEMRPQLLLGGVGGWMTDVTEKAGSPFQRAHIGRGLAVGDLDNDGRLDALLVAVNEPLVYLHNRTDGGHSVTLALEGTKSVRDGVGARIVVESGGIRRATQRFGGGSVFASGDPRVHIGLGESTRIDRLEIRWPSGLLDTFRDVPADRVYRCREGELALEPAPAPAAGRLSINEHR
ncbi:FG-GAP-like repeat-containing protein [Aquisphaera insulae]|uniref:FG-GAP-like repeat-containing protein n=1 Tax=Aquisphaera insulae TaxID=2712864 RepID=UPI0013ECF54A|nr:FG-GAP-like repeat-containing protein [Aquisphaera insulae]